MEQTVQIMLWTMGNLMSLLNHVHFSEIQEQLNYIRLVRFIWVWQYLNKCVKIWHLVHSTQTHHFSKITCQLPNPFTWWSCICVYQPQLTHRGSSTPCKLYALTGSLTSVFSSVKWGCSMWTTDFCSTVKRVGKRLPKFRCCHRSKKEKVKWLEKEDVVLRVLLTEST